MYKVDEHITELAALLHDIGRTKKGGYQEHHIVGITEAEKILRDFNYSEDVIEEIKHCIKSHRRNVGPKPKTIIAEIVANADAMAHFDALPVLFYWRGRAGEKIEDVLSWANGKMKDDWEKKITLPEARKIMKGKYKAIKLLLDSLEYGSK